MDNIAKRKPISKALRHTVYRKYGGRCAYCGENIDYETMQVDHLHSVYRGGTNGIDNLMPSCSMCNFYKSTYTLAEFRRQLGLIKGRLEKDYIYRLALKYGLVEEKSVDIQFYFEGVENG